MTPATIDPSIAPLIALLGSTSKGEQAAAVSGIARKLKKTGASFNDLAARIEGGAAPDQSALSEAFQRGWNACSKNTTQREAAHKMLTLADQVEYLARNAHHLRPHEKKFVLDMRKHAWRGGNMKATEKQAAWIEGLYDRLQGEG